MTGTEAVAALPGSVRIGPFVLKIEPTSVHESNGRREWGSCSVQAQKITIQSDMPTPAKAVDTLIHEIMHAIFWAYNIADEDKEERTVASLGTALTALHLDNPWLGPWIMMALA